MAATRILIVEDEIIIARELEARLLGLGYEVVGIASSGREAIALVEQTQPQLVLMDINLQGDMDGIEAAADLQRRGSVPVVYLTAFADDRTLERAKITGPFGYLVKPFAERELRANIEMAIYKHRLEDELRRAKEAAERALAEVKQLRGLLPICGYCKKVRDDQDYWHEVEAYITARSDVQFSHGICPPCLKSQLEMLAEAKAQAARQK